MTWKIGERREEKIMTKTSMSVKSNQFSLLHLALTLKKKNIPSYKIVKARSREDSKKEWRKRRNTE